MLPGAILALAVFLGANLAFAKPIRLRNEVIDTPAPAVTHASGRAKMVAEAPQSGLYLIQFTNLPDAGQRTQLEKLGVELLRFIPEDSYIARLNQVRLADVRGLDFVQWCGPYQARHKMDDRLQAVSGASSSNSVRTLTLAPTIAAAAGSIPVRLLLAPRASGREVGDARSLLSGKIGETKSRFHHILRGTVSTSRLESIAGQPGVLWIEPDRPMRLWDEVSTFIVGGDAGNHETWPQSLGYDGSGVTVAVADSGLNNGDAGTMHPDLFGRTPAFIAYGGLPDAADEHSHGTHCAGIIAGNAATGEADDDGHLYGLGVAPGASIVAQRLFDGVGNYYPPPDFETMTSDALNAGAVIGSNSWGDDTQGRYDINAATFDELVRDADPAAPWDQPYILEFSAGNAGPGVQTIGSPAVAKNVIATGACQNDRRDLFIYDTGPDTMADFSSRGPCEDGRIKPDIVAPGTWIASLKSASATDDNAWSPISSYYIYQGGTSQAGPHASGAAAVFVQYYRETHGGATPSPALVKAALINSTTDMDNTVETAAVPNNDEGWGRLDLTQIIGGTRVFEYLDQTAPLAQGQVHEQRVIVGSAEEPLKVTMAYTDVPGTPAAIPSLVNDLDLEVVSPDGTLYKGNQFDAGESVPDPSAADSINNVEGVFISSPAPGEYLIRVRARRVVDDARQDTPVVDQDFAIVTSGDLPLPGHGIITLDRHFYTAPSQIKIRVIDTDLAGRTNITVLVRSGTETAGESLVLRAATTTGTFTGAVVTVIGPAVADGRLQIAHGDLIEVIYTEGSPSGQRIAAASADLVPPVITGVTTTNEFGHTEVIWNTDEPAGSIVFYSTNTPPTLSVTDTELVTQHQVALDRLITGRTYRFYVTSTDEAGNRSTNNNGGSYFTFTALAPAPVLLVDSYTASFLMTAPPSISEYTATLDQLGVEYDFWDTSIRGTPTYTNLAPYQAVIWRVSEETLSWSSTDMQNISRYLDNGGTLFVASMELPSRLAENNLSAWQQSLLHLQSFSPDAGVSQVIGTDNDPLGSGLDVTLDYAPYLEMIELLQFFDPFFENPSDTIRPAAEAATILFDESLQPVGIRYPRSGVDARGRLVYLSFPLEAVPSTPGLSNNRARLLRNALSFLVPGVNGFESIALDRPAYAIPDVVTVELTASRLAGSSSTNLTLCSTTRTNGVIVPLYETGNPGIFRGRADLVTASTAPSAGRLPVAADDEIWTTWEDAGGGVQRVSSYVDATAPVISGVMALPDYVQAVILWDTDKPADALVQFGESPLLEQSAFDALPDTTHQITLTGLKTDTTYYFSVTSRDEAGNAVTANNTNHLYSFHTLRPLVPDWTDALETGATNWQTYNSDDAQGGWTLATPANDQETAAHSPSKAWCTSPTGEILDYVETFLISPAIYLSGGNSAKLTFWQSYDFTEKTSFDVLEMGQVYVITNGGATPLALAAYGGDAVNWEQAEFDLTPYMGKVVNVVWSYQLFALEPARRPGWMIDDVSVTTLNVATGTLVVSNNLRYPGWSLSGPVNSAGQGTVTLTNAPVGEYAIIWGALPYYQKPASQTNQLQSGKTLTFSGVYAVVDSNGNGIPDAWEMDYFGTVAPSHPGSVDTDHDGMSDVAEFLAGTNPTNAASVLRFTDVTVGSDGSVHLEWLRSMSRSYRVLGSSNLATWTPLTGWMPRAMSVILPAQTNRNAFLYRVEVSP